ncbi:phage antirepressor N-terminal domain-containing protein [Mannheimia bovis]|uniref:phage antirepressor N-terminal domain-containing protein n=1 Tax=Mannheimia bovis TaxID=2770636 RepID=UPI0024B70BAA|nr:phage antirepressor N-terminal domain-containing protein [Mannheimia bovis]WHP46367.1 phage antirepressor N-terminal domain-containing protein [Mannheimia bovis]
MTTQISTQTLSFYGSDLITLKVEDVIYTAIRPIVEAIGLDWASQSVKLNKNKEKFGCCDIATPTNGGLQKMLCMPIKKLNGWLFSINPEKVRSDLKEKVICYQEECFEALYNYWHFGKAERSHIAPIEEPKFTHTLTSDELRDLAWLWFEASKMAETMNTLYQPLATIGSNLAPMVYSQGVEYGNHIQQMGKLIYRLTYGVDFSNNPAPFRYLQQGVNVSPTKLVTY